MTRTVMLAALTLLAALRMEAQSASTPLDSLTATGALAAPVNVHVANQPLRNVLGEIARQANLSIVFDPSLKNLDRPTTTNVDRVPVATVLLRLLDGTGLQAMIAAGGSVVITETPVKREQRFLVSGMVRQGSSPIAGVHLLLAGTRFEASSDAAGQFNFGLVPIGTYTLRALRMGFAPVAQTLRVRAGESTQSVAVSMEPSAVPVDAVIVTPGYLGVLQPGLASNQTLTRQQIETVPQLGEDAYRAIARLPGVSSSEMSADFSVRGEMSRALYVTLDGVPLVEPFHLRDVGNGLSIIDLAALGRAELVVGGPSVEYGSEVGGLFGMHTVEPRTDRVRTSVGFSLTNLRGMSQGGLPGGKGAWLASIRHGFLQYLFKVANIEDSVAPHYDDAFAKVTYPLLGGEVGLHALHATDYLKDLDNTAWFVGRDRSTYYWLTFAGRAGRRVRYENVAWTNRISWSRHAFQPDAAKPAVDVRDERRLSTLGVRSDWSVELGSRALLKLGGDLRHDDARYDYSRFFQRDVAANHGITRRTDTASARLDPSGEITGVYVSQRIRPLDALTLEGGVRYDRATHTGDSYVSPRVNAAWDVTSSTVVRAAWGRHGQSQPVFGLQVEDGDRQFQPAQRSRDVSAGVEQSLFGGIVVRGEAYDRRLDPVFARYESATSRIDLLTEVTGFVRLIAPDVAIDRGVETSVARDGRVVDWSMTYVRSSTRERANGVWIPRPVDQPHAVHVDWTFHPRSNTWRFSVSGMTHTGHPYTPDDLRLDTVQVGPRTSIWTTRELGQLYSRRVPAYQRIDMRWTRFVDGPSGRFSMFLDVFNVLNRVNQRERITTVTFTPQRAVYGEGALATLPRIPSFGLTWEF